MENGNVCLKISQNKIIDMNVCEIQRTKEEQFELTSLTDQT